MKRLGIIALFVVLLIQPFVLSAEQTEDEKRREILQFGLEPEITELIGTLQKEENKTFNDDILNVFNSTKNPVLRESVLSFFAAQKDPALKDFALSTLTDPWDFKTSTVIAVLSYAESISLKEATPSIRKILDGESNEYRAKALSTLGKLGSAEDARYLVESLDGDIPGDDKQKLIIRQNIMAALGELRAVETWDRLVEIAKDTDENAVIRATAATAIGKMGKPEAIPVLSALFEDTDPVLRTAAIEGLSNYSEPGAVSVVLQGFKDSYYKVRLAALAAAGNNKYPEALSYVLYRAKNDPVEAVKYQAFDAAGTYNDAAANAWLRDMLLDAKASDKVRIKAASVLLGNDFDGIYQEFEKVALETLKDDKKASLRYELGKLASKYQSQKTLALASGYLSHKDPLTRSIALDLFERNRYPEMAAAVASIAADEKQGALQRRAKKILGTKNDAGGTDATEPVPGSVLK